MTQKDVAKLDLEDIFMSKKIIDISYHNGEINFSKVKSQVDGIIIRCGYGNDLEKQDDKRFREYTEQCIKHGIPFGFYLYSYAKNMEDANSEAKHCIRLLSQYRDKMTFPVYYDLEEPGTEVGASSRAVVFCEILEQYGFKVGVYSGEYWWNNYLSVDSLKCSKWVAKYGSNNGTPQTKPSINSTYDIWQYTSVGKIDGISGNVDINICYKDFNENVAINKKEISVDGYWGKATTTRLQEIFGTTVDGVISNQWACYKDKNPGLESGTFEWHKKPNGNGSQLIRAMQKWAGMTDCDGEIGDNTIKALQGKLGTTVDGVVSAPSSMVKALQEWANKQ